MSKTEDVSLVGGLYENQSLRFSVFPTIRTDFESAPYLETLAYEPMNVRWTEQGVLSCQRGDFSLLYDIALGIFKLSIKKKEVLNGSLQTGQFSAPLFSIELKESEKIYGFGAASGKSDRNGHEFQLLNRDTLCGDLSQSSYSSFPFFIFSREQEFIGIFWNSVLPAQVSTIDIPEENHKRGVYITPLEETGPVAQDFFIFKGTLAEILRQFFELTGRPFMPPLWSLGYHQSRWSYRTATDVLELAKRFRQEKVPCDAIHLDIHYMDRFRVFTWHPLRFAHPKGLHKELHNLGFRTAAIVDPGVAVDENYPVYQSGKSEGHFCKNSLGQSYTGSVWPGRCVFPDFSRKETQGWWANLHQALFAEGVSGIWNDMNEPVLKIKKKHDPLTEGMFHDKKPHSHVRNLYANLEAQASYASFAKHPKRIRPWVLTRAAFCGIQKYAALWTGDNQSSWQHLRENLYMALNLSLSGVPFCGADVGGFAAGGSLSKHILRLFKWYKKSELFTRWMELGSLMPFFRVHTTLFSHQQEPWSFGPRSLKICRKHIQRRYSLLPYLYSLAHDIHSQGSLWVRPLAYDFPKIDSSLAQDQFLLGPALLAAPVLYPGIKTLKVYLPPGAWYEYESGTLYEGGTTHHFRTPLDYYPLFVRAGTILPRCYPKQNTKDSLDSSLILEIYPLEEMNGSLYLDDGISSNYAENIYTKLEFEGKMSNPHSLTIRIKVSHKNYIPPLRHIDFRLPTKFCYLQNGIQRIVAKEMDLKEEDRKFTVSSFRVPYGIGKYVFRTK